jgi:hypothetical protein
MLFKHFFRLFHNFLLFFNIFKDFKHFSGCCNIFQAVPIFFWHLKYFYAFQRALNISTIFKLFIEFIVEHSETLMSLKKSPLCSRQFYDPTIMPPFGMRTLQLEWHTQKCLFTNVYKVC